MAEQAGSRALTLFATPLNHAILQALAARPMRLAELEDEMVATPQTTLRGHLRALAEIGAVERRKRAGSAKAVDNVLTPLGRELLGVADALEGWLRRAPGGPIALDGERGTEVVRSLAGGWESTILPALAGGSHSLTELDRSIGAYSYAALERRLSTLEATGQIEALPSPGTRTLYAVTDWARRAIGPLAIAARCERRHMAEVTPPITSVEVEAAFLLALPLVSLPAGVDGACVLAVYTGAAEVGRPASGVRVEVEDGRVRKLAIGFGEDQPSWALNSADVWMNAVIDGKASELRIGGSNPALARSLVEGLHGALFES